MLSQICFSRQSLHLDIADMAYIAADVQADGTNAHLLHPTTDICEAANLPRINSLLDLAFSEALHLLSPLIKIPSSTEKSTVANGEMLSITFRESAVTPVVLLRIRETLREYLIASALYGWLSVSLPAASIHWKEVKDNLLSSLGSITPLVRSKRRRQSPF